MSSVNLSEDPVMTSIVAAVSVGRNGDAAVAREQLLEIWQRLGTAGDPLHRCVLAHYLADLFVEPAMALVWDVRSLDAADAISKTRADEVGATFSVAGFYPSLHLNLADDFRRLGLFDVASIHIAAAEERLDDLPADDYGDSIRTALDQVAEATSAGDTARLPGSVATD